MLIDKEKTQIDVAMERMMTWTEDLEEESPLEEQENIEENEDEAYDPNDKGKVEGGEEDDNSEDAFEAENNS